MKVVLPVEYCVKEEKRKMLFHVHRMSTKELENKVGKTHLSDKKDHWFGIEVCILKWR